MGVQIILTLGLFGIAGVVAYLFYRKRKNEIPDEIHYATITMPYLLETVKRRVVEITRDDEVLNVSNSVYKVRQQNKERLNQALTDCIDAIKSAREIVIALIRDIIKVEIETEEDCYKAIDFSGLDYLDWQTKWIILVYVLGIDYGNDVINYIEEKYNITEIRDIILDDGRAIRKREFSGPMLDEVFQAEVIDGSYTLHYDEYLDIISRKLFADYKGFGEIDDLRQLKVDGFNYGTSGSIRYEIDGKWDAMYRSTNSVWVQINAQWVHFSFIDFHSMSQMRRITRQLTAYGNLGPMTEKNPIKVTDSPDGSRITALGPPVGECWACFVRKFNLSVYSMQQLFDKPYAKNYELPTKLLYFIAKAEQNIPFTGQQNTGKTTAMKAFIELCDLMNIRVLEMSFELALREIYPWMNIFTAKPTQHVGNSKIQDTFKKTDAYLSILGEIAEDEVVPFMVQFALIASAFTTFSSHHKNDYALIYGLANSWTSVRTGMDKNAAISDILDVIKLNCHLDFANAKDRVIAYISEIIKLNELQEYPAIYESSDMKGAIDQQTKIIREFATRTTDRVKFESRKIVVYDLEKQAYVPNDWFSDEMTYNIVKKLNPADRVAFKEFADENFMEVRLERARKDKEARERAMAKRAGA